MSAAEVMAGHLAVRSIDDRLDFAADLTLAPGKGDLLLRLHQPTTSRLLYLFGQMIGQPVCRCAGFARIGEDAAALELHRPDKVVQLHEILVSFAGEADDEG